MKCCFSQSLIEKMINDKVFCNPKKIGEEKIAGWDFLADGLELGLSPN